MCVSKTVECDREMNKRKREKESNRLNVSEKYSFAPLLSVSVIHHSVLSLPTESAQVRRPSRVILHTVHGKISTIRKKCSV